MIAGKAIPLKLSMASFKKGGGAAQLRASFCPETEKSTTKADEQSKPHKDMEDNGSCTINMMNITKKTGPLCPADLKWSKGAKTLRNHHRN